MATDTVHITISFDTLLAAIAGLNLVDKQRLLDVLEEQLAQAEEAAWEQDPTVRAEMQQSRDEYARGESITLEEYLAERQDGAKPAS